MPQRIHNALFWFINKNRIDETALNYLKDGDIDKTIDIWQKTLKEEITDINYVSYANLSTLFLGLASANGSINKHLLQQGIELKSKLLNSDKIRLIVSDITRNWIVPDLEKLNSDFVNEIIELTKPYLENKQILPKEMISYFSSFPANIKKIVLSKFTDTHIYNIENEIEKTIEKRKASPRDAEEHGEALYKNTKKDIKELKKIFGKDNIQFQMIANKVANELLQCSIDFFNTHREEESEFDPGEDALRIAKYANSVGATGQVKNRIIENTQSIQEWVDSKEEREKQKAIKNEIDFIVNKLDNFQRLSNTIDNARNLINSCKPKLQKIKNEIGSDDELYLQLSSAVVQNAQGMIIIVVNTEQLILHYDKTKLAKILSNALSALSLMGSLDMIFEVRTRYNKNKETIYNIYNQVSASSIQTWASKNPGCIVAIIIIAIGILFNLIYLIFAN